MPGTPRRPEKPIPARPTASRPASGPASSRPTPRPQASPLKGVQKGNVVRPAAPPQRVMPQKPAPVARAAVRPAASVQKPAVRPLQQPARQPVKPTNRPARPTGTPARPAGGTAGMVGAGVNRAAAAAALNTAGAHADISAEVESLNSALRNLTEKASFNDTVSDFNRISAALDDLVALLDSARDKGYCYAADLDNEVYKVKGQWDTMYPQLFDEYERQVNMISGRLPAAYEQIDRVNRLLRNPAAARPAIQSAHTQINTLLQTIDGADRRLENRYRPIEETAGKLRKRLNDIHWSMDQLVDAKFARKDDEELVLAVAARWDKEGKEDPEGIFYLTNKRLIFEQKEKVAVKKILFITTASELVHEVLIDQPWNAVRGVKPDNKGLFGHQDYVNVTFAERSLGTVAFHINGQDAKEWAALMERVRSGQIENDRFTGQGISAADLTRVITADDIVSLQNEARQLQDEMMLKSIREDLAEVENDVFSLARRLAELRAKGYAMEKALDADITILTSQWERIKANADKVVEHQTNLLSQQMAVIQGAISSLAAKAKQPSAARSLYVQAKSAMAAAASQAYAAQQTVAAQYGGYASEIEEISAHLDWVGWMLDALSTASFRLLATESGIAAAEAMWASPGLEPENGILFLTDQRLLWEDRVDAFELKVDIPLQLIRDARRVEEGGSEYLEFTFESGAPYPSTRFEFSLPVAEDWVKIVGRARTGEYSQGRAIEVDPAELERIRSAPDQCPKCGGAFTAPILRGQTSISCEYCGNVIQI